MTGEDKGEKGIKTSTKEKSVQKTRARKKEMALNKRQLYHNNKYSSEAQWLLLFVY